MRMRGPRLRATRLKPSAVCRAPRIIGTSLCRLWQSGSGCRRQRHDRRLRVKTEVIQDGVREEKQPPMAGILHHLLKDLTERRLTRLLEERAAPWRDARGKPH